MKNLIVFDLDGTLADSKSSLDGEMSAFPHDLLGIVKVAVISGGGWPQFEKQLISNLPHDDRLMNLSLLPTCGTQFFQYEGDWKQIYSEDLSTDEKEKIVRSLEQAVEEAGFKPEKVWGELSEDRGSQITFSALGQQAPLEEKDKWDADFTKRKKIKAILDKLIPEFSVRMGGATSIDVTKPGINKAYGIRKLRDRLGIPLKEMLFTGDALFEGGNDYPAEEAGVVCIAVRGVFPRLVARGNYSRIGIARVRFNEAGDPADVERLGIAIEPEADYERRVDGSGGCEDPRITFVEPLHRYIMTYTAFSPEGPRIAMAISEDLFRWQRLGLATFAPYHGMDFTDVDNKDASLFPVAIPNPSGQPQLAILHRPLFPGTRPEETACHPACRCVDLNRESIWISYCPMALDGHKPDRFGKFTSHHRLATPASPWERLKIGGGTPPILTRHGWLIVYHGVSEVVEPDNAGPKLRYSAGVMVLSKEHPRVIRYRSKEPVLMPVLPQERRGTVANVVFPTGIDRRDDLAAPDRFDVYYGMADSRIGVARLDVPEVLPPEGVADPPEATV